MASPYLIAFRLIYYMPGEIFLHPGARMKVETDYLLIPSCDQSNIFIPTFLGGTGVYPVRRRLKPAPTKTTI
jgi:hypothetical protein